MADRSQVKEFIGSAMVCHIVVGFIETCAEELNWPVYESNPLQVAVNL